jgi:hypothetical protein
MVLGGLFSHWVLAAAGVAVLLFLYVLKRPAVAKVLTAVGGALLAIRRLRADIDTDLGKLPDSLYLLFLIGGLVCVVVGLIGMIIPFQAIFHAIKEFIGSRLESPRFTCRPAKANELEELLTFGRSFFGDEIADINSIRKWHGKNPNLFCLVHEVSKSKGKKIAKLVGFFDVIPITKKAEKGLPIYTRPVTKRGLQLAKKHDFAPVNSRIGNDELLRIHKLN